MKYLACLLIGLFYVSNIFASNSVAIESQGIDELYSFENDFEGWTIRGTFSDADLASLVTRSQERAFDGVTSLKFACPASFQTILIERAFSVEPNQVYDVEIDYAFATREGRDSLSSTIPRSFGLITGAFRRSADQELREILSAIQGTADNGEDVSGNYKWLTKQFAFTARTDEQGKLYIVIGINSSEGSGTFYFDKAHVRIIKKPEPCEFFSFENDFEGWTANAADLDFQGTPIQWSVTRSHGRFQDGETSLQIDANSLNGKAKIWIEKAFAVEPKKKYRVNVEYGFLSQFNVSHSQIITGVVNRRPETAEDLGSLSQGETGESGFPWKRKQYEFNIKAKRSGVLYVVIGIFAKQQGLQVYNFDNLCITLTKK